MINAVSGGAEKLALTSRPSGEELLRRAGAPSELNAPASEPDSAEVKISSEGNLRGQTRQAEVSVVSEFDEADANQDGTVNVLERRAYDFLHPTLERYPGNAEAAGQHAIAAELKVYEAVARNGRNL